jgi:hypothetical protein
MIDVFISPTSSWHPPVTPPKPPQPPPGLDRPALALFNALKRHGRYGSLIWPLLNEVAAEQQPMDRAEARRMRLELWWQLRRLMKVGLVFRYTRKSISVYNLPRHTVNRRRRSWAGSTRSSTLASKARQRDIPVSKSGHPKMMAEYRAASFPQPSVAKSESAQAALSGPALPISIPVKPDTGPPLTQIKEQEERIRQAAQGLARLPRNLKRRWSGFVNGVRVWHNRKIILPGGKVA